jgi:hypothetical protein
MSLLVTENRRTGERRYFVNGRRTTREGYDAATFWRRLECLHSTTRGNVTRFFAEAR